MNTKHSWKVLLIGGASGTGKTTLARQLAQHYGADVNQVDDYRLFVQSMTTSNELPVLHGFLDSLTGNAFAQTSPEKLRDGLIMVAELVSRGLDIVVAHHVAIPNPIILEGDGISPKLAAQSTFGSRFGEPLSVGPGDIRAVFLYEPDEAALFTAMRGRDRGFARASRVEQDKIVRIAWLYGQWLRTEAEQYGVPVVVVQPWQTLAERVIAITEV